MDGIYKIELIPNDLSTEETINQIADTLDNLNGIVDDVFTKLMTRIEENLSYAKSLQKHIDISGEKVDKLTGLTKAVQVFSTPKYPASHVYKDYTSVIGPEPYKYIPAPRAARHADKTALHTDKDLQEKLHFYHVKVSQTTPSAPEKRSLGSVLESLDNVGELLVFDTDESPYVSVGSAQARLRAAVAERKHDTELGDAPASIANREHARRDTDDYLYTPGMGMVPELEMPLDLPHLPGIAGDVQFSHAGAVAIAPSALTSPVAPPSDLLPDLDQVESAAVADDTTPPPPLPPPPPPAPTLPPPPAPPPPPPPPAPSTTREDARTVDITTAAPPPAPAADAHSSLMAAIRQVGGVGKARLRAAAAPTQPKAAPSSGDLMADLHAKLSMRRKGISGNAPVDSRSVLESLSAVIAEPSGDASASSEHASSDDNDWD